MSIKTTTPPDPARTNLGNWYIRPVRPQRFQVFAQDPDEATVDIEYFDGNVDEWPTAHWLSLAIEPSEQPHDWTGPFDEIEHDDPGFTEVAMAPEGRDELSEGEENIRYRRQREAQARANAKARRCR